MSRRWKYAIPLLTLTAGALLAAGAVTARSTDPRGGGGRTKLIAQIEQENDRIRLDRSSSQRLREDALWAGGATGVQIMDQRLIDTSAVGCVGNTLILQGVVYSPPFRIAATGDPERLRAALEASPEISLYKDFVSRYGLGYTVRNLDKITLPAFAGSVSNRCAAVFG